MGNEFVLGVEKSVLIDAGWPLGGKVSLTTDIKYKSLALNEAKFYLRVTVESNEDVKQIIPYVVFVCGDSVFSYIRGEGSDEDRLKGGRSIGIGGHINNGDESGIDMGTTYSVAFNREIAEEVTIVGVPVIGHRPIGILNDDSTEVGRVHMGCLHVVNVPSVESVKRKESQIQNGRFVSFEELRERYEELENWSQISFDFILSQRGLPVPGSPSREFFDV